MKKLKFYFSFCLFFYGIMVFARPIDVIVNCFDGKKRCIQTDTDTLVVDFINSTNEIIFGQRSSLPRYIAGTVHLNHHCANGETLEMLGIQNMNTINLMGRLNLTEESTDAIYPQLAHPSHK
jgi:hypothetical protein